MGQRVDHLAVGLAPAADLHPHLGGLEDPRRVAALGRGRAHRRRQRALG